MIHNVESSRSDVVEHINNNISFLKLAKGSPNITQIIFIDFITHILT